MNCRICNRPIEYSRNQPAVAVVQYYEYLCSVHAKNVVDASSLRPVPKVALTASGEQRLREDDGDDDR
jgi:hypothetical protein